MNNMKHKILMTLALLITAVGGAWAEKVTVTFTQADLNCTGTVAKDGVTLTPSTGDAHSYTNLYDFGSTTFSVDKGKFTKIEIVNCTYGSISGWQKVQTGSYQQEPEMDPVPLYTLTWTGEAESVTFKASVFEIQSIVFTINKPDVDVTLNDTKTEATMESMPTYDVTVDYELVRDMSVSMTTKIGDGKDGYRIRLQKNEQTGKYEPAEMTVQQMMALAKVHDAIENQDLTFGVLDANCIVNIYAANDENQAVGDPIAIQDLVPGRYIAKAVAATGSAYEGETGMSNIFELYEGYQVVIPAGEYVTYYKDEAVRLDEKDKNDIELCTITAVEDGKAVLSENFDAMKANTPFLLKNTTTEEKTILLIPCTEPNLAVTVAKEFKGTEGACEFSEALMATGDFYVCNGKEFIKVRGAGTLAPNKAFLFVEGNNTPASIPFRRSIGGEGEGTTGVDASLVNSEEVNSVWYDLNGRRLQGKPSQKGIYIKNGRKVVIK